MNITFKAKRYIVAEYKPRLRGLTNTGYFWRGRFATNNAKVAADYRRNWQKVTSHRTVVFDTKEGA